MASQDRRKSLACVVTKDLKSKFRRLFHLEGRSPLVMCAIQSVELWELEESLSQEEKLQYQRFSSDAEPRAEEEEQPETYGHGGLSICAWRSMSREQYARPSPTTCLCV